MTSDQRASAETSLDAKSDSVLGEVRQHRAALRESMSTLERALAAPPAADLPDWVRHVQGALVDLSADFRQHIDVTEGPDGLYEQVQQTSPRLSGAVARLIREHVVITDLVDELVGLVGAAQASGDEDRVRELGTALLSTLIRHRQRGSDLVYGAYDVDIGGET